MALAVLFALRGVVFAPQKLEPKLSRISLLSNAKNKFGLSGLMEFAKSTLKLVIYGLVLWLFLRARLPDLLSALGQSPGPVTVLMLRMMSEFLAIVVAIMVVIGAVDYLWQRFDHHRKQRMSHQELREDHKQAEGDPHLKQKRRQRATEFASNRMLTDVPGAAVVIVNPTHYAVALKWQAGSTGAPVCVAKGTDEIAARIREIALDNNVPIHSDPPTARALFATTRIGAEILPEHYREVAAAIRFADEMRQRAARRGETEAPLGPAPAPGAQPAPLDPALLGARLAHRRWIEAQQKRLNQQLALVTADYLRQKPAAARAFGRAKVLEELGDRARVTLLQTRDRKVRDGP